MHDTHQDISGHQIEQKKKLRPFADFCARFADFLRSVCGLGFAKFVDFSHDGNDPDAYNGYMRDPDAMWSVHDMHA